MIIASAPATLMVCGEHSVVYGHQALVCAVKPRLKVCITPREDRQVIIHSALAEHQTDIETLADQPKLRFLLQALREEKPRCGVSIRVESEINPTMGLGSSAAVIVASLAALLKLNAKSYQPSQLHATAMKVLLAVQKQGSGADLAAAIKGGLINYQKTSPPLLKSLPIPPAQLSLRYAGYKTPTAEVLALVAEKARTDPQNYQHLYQKMGTCTEKTVQMAEEHDWTSFYQYLNEYQTYMMQLGVCDDLQKAQIAEAKTCAFASKISGSGLGDCIIAFSEHLPAAHTPLEIDTHGVLYE